MTNLLHLIVLSVTTFTNTNELQRFRPKPTETNKTEVLVEYKINPGDVLPEHYQVRPDGIFGMRMETNEVLYSFSYESTNVANRIFTKTLIGTPDLPLFCIVSHRKADLSALAQEGWGDHLLGLDDMSIWSDFFIADPDWTPHSH